MVTPEEIAIWEPRIERALELKPFSQEYDDLMDEIKEGFKGRTTMLGKYLVRSKPYSTTTYKVPKEIKAAYAVTIEGHRLTIETL